jgi:Putative zinc-finger
MNAMTCHEVQEQLDLLAAAEIDPPMRDALENHLRQCEACAARYAESQRMLGLLDLQFRQDGLERLQRRIEEEARPRRNRRFFSRFNSVVGLVAALVLIALGLIWWLPRDTVDRPKVGVEFALLVRAGKDKPEIAPRMPATLKNKPEDAVATVALAERDGAAFRQELKQAQRDGKLPLPPVVSLELVLVNTGKLSVEVRLGDANAQLTLEVAGDGVVRVAAPDAETPQSLRPQTLQLEPGAEHVLQIERLVAGSPGKLEYIYLTEPGEFTLTPRLQLTADAVPITVTGTKMRIKVGNQAGVLPR